MNLRPHPWPQGNAAGMLLGTAAACPNASAVLDDVHHTSYRVLAERALAIAGGLRRGGLEEDDRVAILLRRGADAAAAFFGVLAAGAIAVIVNESLRPRQIEHILRHSGARSLLASRSLLARLPRPLVTEAGIVEFERLPAVEREMVPRQGADVAQIIYTSGSTGLPKGVAVSHANLWAGMQAVTTYLGITGEDRIASLLPFSFDYGLNQLLCCAGTGATLVVERAPVPQRIVRTLAVREVTVLPAVPPLWLQLIGVTEFSHEPLPALRVMTNTGGRLPEEAVRSLRRSQPHADLVLMYGLTEAFRSAYLPPARADAKPTSVGQAIPGAEILVLDDDLNPCKPGQVGQLVHRGPTVALGYWDDEEATAARFRPNPLRAPGTPAAERVVFSGDLVYRDEQGDLFFVGRRDAMIKTLGYRVAPDEVTEVLYASGEVAEALVTAEDDEVRGSAIVAHVVLRAGGELHRLRAFCAREMPHYLRPSRFKVHDALPRTATGKFDAAAAACTPDAHEDGTPA